MEEERAKAIEAAKQGAIEILGAQIYSQLMEGFADLRQGISKDIAQVLAAFIGEKFLSFNPNVWKDEQNLYALLIYLFNDGNPSVVRVI
ncbi:hypothetical protein ME3_01069 [Bartonella melophagi K-2C]|uniref:Uncharacterized protein n=2 Tax=Bartonella melophagi TaxID=291176 RepID=J1JUB2_9HYPH|nr:hypothetical protein ME3_01069 [Bartonella melophagi K-2C]